MALNEYTLYAPAGSFRAFASLIAAEYNGIHVDVVTDQDDKIATLSPTGKAPVLEIKGKAVLFSGHAIARYLAGLRRDTELLGATLVQQAAVDSWMDFCAQELELPCCVWFYPVAGYLPFRQDAYEKAKDDLKASLNTLNQHLQDKDYLVGEHVTLADIAVASTLVYPFKLVCEPEYLKPYDKVVAWFQRCVEETAFQNVIGEVTMCQKETQAAK